MGCVYFLPVKEPDIPCSTGMQRKNLPVNRESFPDVKRAAVNDLAGQLENFKLAYHTANIEYAINSKTQRVLLTVNGAEREWGKDEIVAALQAVMKQRPNMILSIPWAKDWNDDLRSSKKSISLRIAENMARVQIETTKSEQRGMIAGKLP